MKGVAIHATLPASAQPLAIWLSTRPVDQPPAWMKRFPVQGPDHPTIRGRGLPSEVVTAIITELVARDVVQRLVLESLDAQRVCIAKPGREGTEAEILQALEVLAVVIDAASAAHTHFVQTVATPASPYRGATIESAAMRARAAEVRALLARRPKASHESSP